MPAGPQHPPAPDGRTSDKALVLAVVTFALLTPPTIAIFDLPVSLFGIPLLHVYAFGVWIAAIIVGGIIARRLMREGADGPTSSGA
jgi:hypothetical protein